MKRVVVCLVLSILTVLVAAPVNAQSLRLRAYVPFEFSVGRTLLPAGDYDVDASMGGGMIRLTNAEMGNSVMISAHGAWQPPAGQAVGTLVFRRYGNAYFLSQVNNNLACSSHLIPKTKAEQALSESATLQVPGEDVVVFAKR
jgi:hypothetical protein